MAQKRLASTLLTAGATTAVYTVPAGKSATVSVFARNVGSDSSVVSLAHSQLSNSPADNTSALKVNGVEYTASKQAPLGILNIGTPTISLAVGPQVSSGSDPSPSTSYPPFGIWNESTNSLGYPYNSGWGTGQWSMGGPGYWIGRGYQISGFYSENDYIVMNSSRYPRRVKGYPWDTLDKSYEGYPAASVFGGYDNTPSYYDYGTAGFRQQCFHVNSTGYLTRQYSLGSSTSSNGSQSDYTSSSNSPYWLNTNYGQHSPYALSILPTARLSTANLRLVTGCSWTSGSNAIWGATITDASSNQSYNISVNLTRTNWGGSYDQTSLNWLWFRPVGDYVYGGTANKVFRAPVTSWFSSLNNWTDVTSSFPSNLHFYFPFIEDRNGYGYTITTNGDVLFSKDGATWVKGDTSIITSGIGSLTSAYTGPKTDTFAQFAVYTSTGKYTTLSSLGSPTIKPDAFELDLTVPAKNHLEHRGIILNAGDKVYARATNSDTKIDVYGFEE
jgi:hypothetical protein